AALWRTAAIVRNGRVVLDGPHLNSGGGQGPNGGFTARAGTADPHFHAAHSVIARHVGGVHRGLLGGERSSLTRSAEAERAGTLPGQHVSSRIGNGDDRVVKRCLDVRNAVGDVLAFFFLKLLLLAFFLRCCRRSGCRCCWFCHVSSVAGSL